MLSMPPCSPSHTLFGPSADIRNSCLLSEVLPIGIANIGWKIYIVNAAWDVTTFILIAVFWVETKGLTLEEVDALFEGSHTTAPVLEDVRKGRAQIDVGQYKEDIKANHGEEATVLEAA